MMNVVENSQDEIFEISEEARHEHERLTIEINEIKEKVHKYIFEGDKLEKEVKIYRTKLATVSKHFDKYSETEIRKIYDRTHELQTNLVILRQEEKTLRDKRNDLERRLVSLGQTIERAVDLQSKISVILTYLNDDFKKVNVMLEEAQQKQDFGLKIIEAQEEERKRISREIHDGPAQTMANILLRSELVERTYNTGDIQGALTEIQSLRKLIRGSLSEVRRIIYDLRPMALDDLGLVPTLKKYINTVAEYNKVRIEFKELGDGKRLNQNYEVALFRLVQESLQNAFKHADANLIIVKLEIGNDHVTMLVKDNGKGFDASHKKDKSFGLIGMRERVEILEGKLEIKTGPNQGTSIYIRLPLKIK